MLFRILCIVFEVHFFDVIEQSEIREMKQKKKLLKLLILMIYIFELKFLTILRHKRTKFIYSISLQLRIFFIFEMQVINKSIYHVHICRDGKRNMQNTQNLNLNE